MVSFKGYYVVAYAIRWSLLGSYVYFTTTCLFPVDIYIYCCECCTTSTATSRKCGALPFTLKLNWEAQELEALCTVLCSTLNMHLGQISLAVSSGYPQPSVWLLLGCRLQLGRIHVLGPFKLRHLQTISHM